MLDYIAHKLEEHWDWEHPIVLALVTLLVVALCWFGGGLFRADNQVGEVHRCSQPSAYSVDC